MIDIKAFLDEDGRVRAWPSKQAKKLGVLQYMSEKFELNRVYAEKEVNATIDQWQTIGDYFLFRRGMVDAGYMTRTKTGSEYRRTREEPSRSGLP